jgi:ribosomal-protein-alanine N-acetyltransferase
MTPEVLAEVHATAFDRPWDAATFEDLCRQPGVVALGDGDGFILMRTVVDEAEILTLAVRPETRRRGLGADLVRAGAETARARGAVKLHLEVAEDNAAALALYRSAGFTEKGRRKGYYPRREGPPVAALLLSLNLSA